MPCLKPIGQLVNSQSNQKACPTGRHYLRLSTDVQQKFAVVFRLVKQRSGNSGRPRFPVGFAR